MPCCLFLSFLLRSLGSLVDRLSPRGVVADSFAPPARRSGPSAVSEPVGTAEQ